MSRIEGSRYSATKNGFRRGAAARKSDASTLALPRGQGEHPAMASDQGNLDAALIKGVEDIAPNDPQRDHKVRRYIVEHFLRKGLGVEQSGSTAFGSLVEETMARMDADEGLRQDMARAVALLLASSAMTTVEKAGDR
jgi:hypothetical protein